MLKHVTFSVICLLLATGTSKAHYLWIVADSLENGRYAQLYFEEGPGPSDGRYLDPFVKNGKMWLRTPQQTEPKVLSMTEVKKQSKRWLRSQATVPESCGLESYGKFGVYKYGKTPVLLHYNARYLAVAPEHLPALARAKHLELDIIPTLTEKGVSLNVLWQGQPVRNRTVKVRGPLNRSYSTDKNGQTDITLNKPGLYHFHCNIVLNQSGEDAGTAYNEIHHHATLSILVPKRD